MKQYYYGVNIGKEVDGKKIYERYLTFTNSGDAKKVFDVLILGNEQEYWSSVEIEEIQALDNGDYEYKTILEANITKHSNVYGGPHGLY